MERRSDREITGIMGGGAFHRRDRSPHGRVEECRRWQGTPLEPCVPALADPARWRAHAAPAPAATGSGSYLAGFVRSFIPDAHRIAAAGGRTASAGVARRMPAQTRRAGNPVLLADRRARDEIVSFLRCGRDSRQAVLRRSRIAGLCAGQGQAGRRGITGAEEKAGGNRAFPPASRTTRAGRESGP